jgi:hypothetical protein
VHTVVGIVAVLWAGWFGARIPVGARDIFLVFKMSSLALGPIQPPVQGIYPQDLKWPGHVADHSLPFSAEDRSDGACLLLPLYVILVCTGTTELCIEHILFPV